jgi:hypothetical protein
MRYIIALLAAVLFAAPAYSQHRHGHRHYVPHHYHPRVPPPRAYYPPPRAYYAPPPVYYAPRNNRWRDRAATAAIITMFGSAAAYYIYCNNNPDADICY